MGTNTRTTLLTVGGALLAAGVSAFLVFGRGHDLQGPEARALVANGALLLDVRSPGEFASSHLPQAINVPVQELEQHLGELGAKDHDLVVYCRSGHRSARASEVLRSHGFTKVHDLGPMTAW